MLPTFIATFLKSERGCLSSLLSDLLCFLLSPWLSQIETYYADKGLRCWFHPRSGWSLWISFFW